MTETEALQYFEYDDSLPQKLRWRPRTDIVSSPHNYRNPQKTWNSNWAGKPAGSVTTGYWCVLLKGKWFKCHRLIYAHFFGEIPKGAFVDHVDGNPLNNEISNLRIATCAQNNANSKCGKNHSSGLKGAHFRVRSQKYESSIRFGGKLMHLGCFKTAQEAHQAYIAATIKYNGEFARW